MSQLPSSDPYLEEHSLHYGSYLAPNIHSDFSHATDKEEFINLKERIDFIPNCLVALFRSFELFHLMKKYCGWAMHALSAGLRYGLADTKNSDNDANPPKNSLKEQKEMERKKRIEGKDTPKPTGLMQAAIRQLKRASEFFASLQQLQPLCWINAFFVEKSNGLLRVILDCRWPNCIWKPSAGKFTMFTFETLRQVIDNLSAYDQWYFANLDLRHWFHQIPLPHRFKKYMGLPVQGANNEWHTYFPMAIPMGWTFSPLIAQSNTWALVLYRQLGHDAKYDLPDLGTLKRYNSPFPWIPLRSGGGIFVLLDNILVVSPHKQVRDAWVEAIVENCNHFHAYLKTSEKELKVHPNTSYKLWKEQPINDLKLIQKECCGTMSRAEWKEGRNADAAAFTFCGVEWRFGDHRVPLKKKGDLSAYPDVDESSPNYNRKTGVWKGSRRQLASVVGRLMWYRRVHNIKFADQRFKHFNRVLRKSLSTSYSERWRILELYHRTQS